MRTTPPTLRACSSESRPTPTHTDSPPPHTGWPPASYNRLFDDTRSRCSHPRAQEHRDPAPHRLAEVATGSLGQGICAAVGIALNARRIKSDYRTYALLGDGETAEGSVWEAADTAACDSLDNLCGITDVNALGQSRPTMWRHDMEA